MHKKTKTRTPYLLANAVAPSRLTSMTPAKSNLGLACKMDPRMAPMRPLPITATLAFSVEVEDEKKDRLALFPRMEAVFGKRLLLLTTSDDNNAMMMWITDKDHLILSLRILYGTVD